ncbi:MAG TPA: ACT domain-containing protein [Clostridiaceae bacterium]|jgi:chorismate mutase|nr:ACT domain-containing protein [Clostridiaceae bacterium]
MAERYLLVSEDVCPAIFGKVVQAKKLLTLYKDKTQTEILNEVGISRSAFYKYKDKVFVYDRLPHSKVVSLYFVVEDFSGILHAIIGEIAKSKGNILTINQNVPQNGIADVIISIDTECMIENVDAVLKRISEINGVRRSEILNREME